MSGGEDKRTRKRECMAIYHLTSTPVPCNQPRCKHSCSRWKSAASAKLGFCNLNNINVQEWEQVLNSSKHLITYTLLYITEPCKVVIAYNVYSLEAMMSDQLIHYICFLYRSLTLGGKVFRPGKGRKRQHAETLDFSDVVFQNISSVSHSAVDRLLSEVSCSKGTRVRDEKIFTCSKFWAHSILFDWYLMVIILSKLWGFVSIQPQKH